jgi:two-component system, OmpR family, response regulator MtrA
MEKPVSHQRILIVEDDPAIADFVQTALKRESFETELVKRGDMVLARFEASPPDLVLLDLMLPGMDGLDVCKALRLLPQYIPIIMLTAKDDDVDKIVGLEIGADDYITKPFKIRELIARIRARLRSAQHSTGSVSHILRFDSVEINIDGRTVTRDGQIINLSPKEFDLLVLLASNPRRVYGRETLLKNVWGFDFLGESRTVDVHIQRLRQKIELDSSQPRFLVTVRSIGYKFNP